MSSPAIPPVMPVRKRAAHTSCTRLTGTIGTLSMLVSTGLVLFATVISPLMNPYIPSQDLVEYNIHTTTKMPTANTTAAPISVGFGMWHHCYRFTTAPQVCIIRDFGYVLDQTQVFKSLQEGQYSVGDVTPPIRLLLLGVMGLTGLIGCILLSLSLYKRPRLQILKAASILSFMFFLLDGINFALLTTGYFIQTGMMQALFPTLIRGGSVLSLVSLMIIIGSLVGLLAFPASVVAFVLTRRLVLVANKTYKDELQDWTIRGGNNRELENGPKNASSSTGGQEHDTTKPNPQFLKQNNSIKKVTSSSALSVDSQATLFSPDEVHSNSRKTWMPQKPTSHGSTSPYPFGNKKNRTSLESMKKGMLGHAAGSQYSDDDDDGGDLDSYYNNSNNNYGYRPPVSSGQYNNTINTPSRTNSPIPLTTLPPSVSSSSSPRVASPSPRMASPSPRMPSPAPRSASPSPSLQKSSSSSSQNQHQHQQQLSPATAKTTPLATTRPASPSRPPRPASPLMAPPPPPTSSASTTPLSSHEIPVIHIQPAGGLEEDPKSDFYRDVLLDDEEDMIDPVVSSYYTK